MGFDILISSTTKRSEEMYNLFLTSNPPTDPPVWLVCLLGIAVVFVGLLCIIGLVELMTFICNKLAEKSARPQQAPATPAPVSSQPSGAIENRGEIIAAVCAAVAEENGTDISAIRVISFKKVN